MPKAKTTALAIMRLQPLHEGHKILINSMFDLCDEVVIMIGSINSSDKKRNPFSYKERKEMLDKSFPHQKNLTVLGIEDIGAQSRQEWIDYVKSELEKKNIHEITHYFSGSREDASWYQDSGWKIEIIDRMSIGKGINATQIRESIS
jgi:cytidyltransferase-like protein